MADRLQDSISPYLQQHAHQPVDWWPWCPEAFAEARRRDVPVFLSVGYASCHWCHVMAHDSFDDAAVGRRLSQDYVAIKVDRAERPDVDAVYMQVTTAMTGQGGWPMTCLLTPEGAPFWAGTFLPRESLLELLRQARVRWDTDRDSVLQVADHVVDTLSRHRSGIVAAAAETSPVTTEDLGAAVRALASAYDTAHGGFGGAPKFPPLMNLAALLRHHRRTGDEDALAMARGTCLALAMSGTYDQLGGGLARYAVDRAWVVPHFEKMLNDNALLVLVATELAEADPTAREWAARMVRETVTWLLDELWTEQAAFAAGLDADTDGVEGATYTWTPQQLHDALGPEEGERAAALLGVTEDGPVEGGTCTLRLTAHPEDVDRDWWSGVRERLLLTRTLRPQPERDETVITAWNGLVVGALARAGAVLEEPDWVDVAARCARFLLESHVVDGRLHRSSRDGRVGPAPAVAEDHGNLAWGLVELALASGEDHWRDTARRLLDTAEELFGGQDRIRTTGRDAEELVLPADPVGDNAEPGSASSLLMALTRFGRTTGDGSVLAAAVRLLPSVGATLRESPRFSGWALLAAEELAEAELLGA